MIKIKQTNQPKNFFYNWLNYKETEKYNSKYSECLKEYFLYFNNKCVFCESPLLDMNLMVGYYRPVEGALNIINGEFSQQHYHWLNKEWSNTLILCFECNRAKSNRFPLIGEFCSEYANDYELNKEKRLLINPSRDYPEKHFLYNKEGVIIPKTKKGEVTINVLNLNRYSLIKGRKKEFSNFNNLCKYFMDKKYDVELLEEIIEQIKPEAPFAGIKRYFLLKMINNDLIPYLQEFTPYLGNLNGRKYLLENYEYNNMEEKNEIFFAQEQYYNRVKINNTYNVRDEQDLQKYFSRQRYIESVEINNFKGLKDIKIDFNLSQSKDAPWLVLLGENGVGKSSILQAISIGLMGEEKRKEIIKNRASDYVNNQQNKGFIKINLTGMIDPIQIEFSKYSHNFSGNNHIEPKVLILSYGSTRLLPNEVRSDNFKPSWARVENLFNPFQSLIDAESYLTWLHKEDFEKVKNAIENIFLEKVEIIKIETTKEIKFKFADSIVKLNDLSDGYKTIIALATDIMMVMKNRWRNYDAEGIVLIDELDSHLHPRWNIEIVKRLRTAFPKIQFIATTHNPLTLRGLLKNEIAVMLEDDSRKTIIQDLPEQKGMKVEEILTSKYFGLYDTLPELNNIFQEYYSLLANPYPTIDQQKRINELEGYLADYNKIGLTKRDQLFYKAIDIYLAKEKEQNRQLNFDTFTQDIKNIIKSLRRLF
ncbi:AAA family ATPase [Rummeliibacillus stabekisii]|uniref:Chromosome segregation protein SMC n=1 Tax=Rummeliibacillus stabekisii TaxID=241244 RepID=A0A143HEU9_9BACL|nr:AAA family ATPase [Rummeliibacillus stabekisii]AMW99771.1 chromosome segregation protein SMC [Rummeliibacillus stabekisii]